MDDPAHWLALHRAPKFGVRRIARLIERYGSPQAILGAGRKQLAEEGLPDDTLAYLTDPDWSAVKADLAWLEQPSHHLLILGKPHYPDLLAEIDDPPPLLFIIGDPEVLNQIQLAMVGSRRPTAGGDETARQFARHLASRGLVITSGLAQGVDGAAHEGTLEGGGITVAVAGTGLDRVYPAAHRELAHRIAAEGALVSEYPLGTPPAAQNFPRRNRIISGLSLGVLVVEAAKSSGSLITARTAAEQGREVFAIPGSIHNPMARGCHQLLRQGAKLVETADDILEELVPLLPDSPLADMPLRPENEAAKLPEPDAGYSALLEAMGHDPVSIDLLVKRTGMEVAELSSMLLALELQGLVSAPCEGRYTRLFHSNPAPE